MPRLLAVLALLACAPSGWAQSVRLQLFDHIVGTELTHNAPLPSGTEVFVVSKAETRAVRLRSGYSEVIQGIPGARRDRVGTNGQTEGTYVPTARARRSYYVAARLPDGRLFQSFVKTADAGWQPGFDAVTGGRVSMGLVTGVVEATLRAALPPRETARAAAPRQATPAAQTPPPGAGAESATGPPASGTVSTPSDSSTLAALGAPDSTGADSTRTDTTVSAVTALDSLGALDTVPAGATRLDAPEDAPASRAWLWALAGLALGAGLAALVLVPRYERRLREQREHLVRLVPDADARAQQTAARRASESVASEADVARMDRALAHVEQLQGLVRTRDAEIQRLREELGNQLG